MDVNVQIGVGILYYSDGEFDLGGAMSGLFIFLLAVGLSVVE